MERSDEAQVEAGVPSKRRFCGCWGGKDPDNAYVLIAVESFLSMLLSRHKLSPYMHHAARRLDKSGLADMMPSLFLLHHTANKAHQLIITGSTLHRAIEIMIEEREQAGADLAVGGDPYARAVSAEGMGYRSDDPDLSYSVFE